MWRRVRGTWIPGGGGGGGEVGGSGSGIGREGWGGGWTPVFLAATCRRAGGGEGPARTGGDCARARMTAPPVARGRGAGDPARAATGATGPTMEGRRGRAGLCKARSGGHARARDGDRPGSTVTVTIAFAITTARTGPGPGADRAMGWRGGEGRAEGMGKGGRVVSVKAPLCKGGSGRRGTRDGGKVGGRKLKFLAKAKSRARFPPPPPGFADTGGGGDPEK